MIEKEHEGARWVLRMVCVWMGVVGIQVMTCQRSSGCTRKMYVFAVNGIISYKKNKKPSGPVFPTQDQVRHSKEKISELELMKNIQNLPQKGKKLKNSRH